MIFCLDFLKGVSFLLYYFPIAAVINHHKSKDLKQHKFILLQSWRSEIQLKGFTGLRGQLCSLFRPFPCLFQVLELHSLHLLSCGISFVLQVSNKASSNLSLCAPLLPTITSSSSVIKYPTY